MTVITSVSDLPPPLPYSAPPAVPVKGSIASNGGNSLHTFSPAERSAFVRYINSSLQSNAEALSPSIDPGSNEIFDRVKDGRLLAFLLHETVPGSVDLSTLNRGFRTANAKPFQMLENNQLVLQASRGLGLSLVNISAEDLLEGKPYLVFGLLWQIIRAGMLRRVNVTACPQLSRLCGAGEQLPPETLLLRWLNWHCSKVGYGREVSNFGGDLADSLAYAHLLHSLDPSVMTAGVLHAIMHTVDLEKRAQMILQYSKIIDPDTELFLNRAEDVTSGRDKLNLCFIASLFNHGSGMSQLHEELEGTIESMKRDLLKEKTKASEAAESMKALRRRIAQLEAENSSLSANLVDSQRRTRISMNEKAALEDKFTEALNRWQDSKQKYECNIDDLEKMAADLTVNLQQSRQDFINEKRQVETFTVCADSLADELELFKSRQEKLEYLVEHLKLERQRSDLNASRLRSIYKSFPSTETLCRAVYADLTCSDEKECKRLNLEKIQHDLTLSGFLTKKARDSNHWNRRFFVLRDNFLFWYKLDSDMNAEPRGVIRVDDCTVKYCDNPTKTDLKDQFCLVVEVANHGHEKDIVTNEKSGKLFFYIAAEQYILSNWMEKLSMAAGFWTRKSSLMKMKEQMTRRMSFRQ